MRCADRNQALHVPMPTQLFDVPSRDQASHAVREDGDALRRMSGSVGPCRFDKPLQTLGRELVRQTPIIGAGTNVRRTKGSLQPGYDPAVRIRVLAMNGRMDAKQSCWLDVPRTVDAVALSHSLNPLRQMWDPVEHPGIAPHDPLVAPIHEPAAHDPGHEDHSLAGGRSS